MPTPPSSKVNLLSLPTELHIYLLQFLDWDDLIRLAVTNSRVDALIPARVVASAWLKERAEYWRKLERKAVKKN
jgi:hypothetical protein